MIVTSDKKLRGRSEFANNSRKVCRGVRVDDAAEGGQGSLGIFAIEIVAEAKLNEPCVVLKKKYHSTDVTNAVSRSCLNRSVQLGQGAELL